MGLTLLSLGYWLLINSGLNENKNQPERGGSTQNRKSVFQSVANHSIHRTVPNHCSTILRLFEASVPSESSLQMVTSGSVG